MERKSALNFFFAARTPSLFVLLVLLCVNGFADERPALPPAIQSLALRGARTPAEHALLAVAAMHSSVPNFVPDTKCNFGAATAAMRYHAEYSPEELQSLISYFARPELQKNFVTASGKFRIHYDTSGFNSVDPTDNDHNGIPDYCDAVGMICDSVWQYEINQLGYPAPPTDGGLGGGNEFDFYIEQIQAYGYTNPDTVILNPGSGPHRYSAWCTIDNGFSSSIFSTRGVDAARVTIAHEFFHVIQIGDYGIWDDVPFINDPDGCDASGFIQNRWFFEMSSVWMETQMYPCIRDYLHSSVPPLFSGFTGHPFRSIEDLQFGITPCGDLGYSLVLFWRYAMHKFNNDASLVQRVWQNERTLQPLQAIDAELRSRNFSLADAWCDFTQGLLFTGKRAIDTMNYFDAWEADSLPLMKMRDSLPALAQNISDSSRVMSAAYYSFANPSLFKDYYYAVVTNRDTARGFAHGLGLQGFSMNIDTSAKTFSLSPNMMDWCAILTRDVADESGRTPPFPDPFKIDGAATIFFPISVTIRPNAVELRVFTESGTLAYGSSSIMPQTRSGKLGVAWDGRRNDGTLVNTGVYIYTVGAGANAIIGKIAVERK